MDSGLSPVSILFFSVSRIVPYFKFCIKSLMLKGKKSGTLFSLYTAHMAFQILEVDVNLGHSDLFTLVGNIFMRKNSYVENKMNAGKNFSGTTK